MLNLNHPEDERLAALAGQDPDATEDADLTSHVTSCDRCTELVTELGALRMSLAELPDLRPPRPLRLLPPADDRPAAREHEHDGFATWVRRLFAPALAAGATLALVGAVGTTGFGLPAGQGGAGTEAYVPAASAAAAATDRDGGTAAMGGAEAEASATQRIMAEDDGAADALRHQLPAERSGWPMVLFTGVALIVGAALLRWIVVPRAG